MEERLDSIDDMIDIEDEMIEFLSSQSFDVFLSQNINLLFQQNNSLKFKKLLNNSKELNQFKESLEDHFTWIKEHIDNDSEELIDYIDKQINFSKAYCSFYENAITNINNYVYDVVANEFNKYFRTLKSKFC